MTKFKLAIHNEEREFEVTRQGNKITLDDGTNTAVFHLTPTANQPYTLIWEKDNGKRQQILAAGHKNGDKRQMWVNGRTFQAERIRERGSGGNSTDASLAATIPAVVSQILVNEGDNVNEGETLILLESMKMIIPIHAPYSGTVTTLNCTVGESVQAGVQLINLTNSKKDL
jgi:acetyl-CoA carboxylase biotin carboxyl carrier protein